MASHIVLNNHSRTDDYTLVIDGQPQGTVPPQASATIDVTPGEHELSALSKNEEELPMTCKPLFLKMEDDRTVHLGIEAKHLIIGLYDEQGNQLNGKRGFLCGSLGDGIYCENPIG